LFISCTPHLGTGTIPALSGALVLRGSAGAVSVLAGVGTTSVIGFEFCAREFFSVASGSYCSIKRFHIKKRGYATIGLFFVPFVVEASPAITSGLFHFSIVEISTGAFSNGPFIRSFCFRYCLSITLSGFSFVFVAYHIFL